ncbi:hypothetical protein TcCL_Unassigned02088, partial [Trypanosoma cruzi]
MAEADRVAALRPPAIKRVQKALLVLVVRKWSGELAGPQQSMPRYSFTRVGIAQQAEAACTHGIAQRREQRSTAAAPGHGEKGPCRLHSDWLTDVRMVVVQMPRGCCDCNGLRRQREGTETRCGPHPSRLTVTPVTSSRQIGCSKDRRRQQRSVPSLSHWSATPPTQSLASSPTNTTREQRQKMRHAWQVRSRRSHCCRHGQTRLAAGAKKKRVNTPSKALASRGKTATDTQGET